MRVSRVGWALVVRGNCRNGWILRLDWLFDLFCLGVLSFGLRRRGALRLKVVLIHWTCCMRAGSWWGASGVSGACNS